MLIRTPLTLAAAATSLLLTQTASAALYSTTKVEALYGWNYEDTADAGFPIDNENHAILTVANATGWTYGDSFFFVDVTNLDQGRDGENDFGGAHAEWNLRGNIGKTLGVDLSAGPVTGLYVSGQLDIDRNRTVNKTTHLAGLSADLAVPGFQFFKVFAMYRNDESASAEGSSEQYTAAWNLPFTLVGASFSFEGFVDYITDEGDLEDQLLTQPQLVWHATEHLGVGLEYQYWENKFGLADTDESHPQAMVRWTF
ncbi:outer membrane protein OmpK [Halomonas borealis]|uniref:outer membrane protein OmpK n=1 Tax=Halomonas borealis TaxID=2508710 RepID=UPI0010A06E2D|nr:outer membrane protein OmpK [Halomonas borealis]